MGHRIGTLSSRARRRLLLAAILLTALLVRGWAALRLPLAEGEEEMALADAAALRTQGEPLPVALLYGWAVSALGEGADWKAAVYAGRLLSAALGAAAVLLLALLDPLAGGLLALHTLAVESTGLLSADALTLLTALIAVSTLQRSRHRCDGWFWLSALALGATAAATPAALPLLLALLTLARRQKRAAWPDLALYLALALAVGVLLRPAWPRALLSDGPAAWTATLHRLSPSLAARRNPDAFLYPAPDGLILLLALPGLYWEWQTRRWAAVWLLAGLLLAPVRPAGGPPNALLLLPPLCLAASTAARRLLARLREHETYWRWLRQMVPAPPLAFWLLGGALLTACVIAYTALTLELTLGRLGWSHLTTANSPLPDDTVYAIAPTAGGGMALATEKGAALWTPPLSADGEADWQVWTGGDSPLPADRVRAVLCEPGGALWFGTDAGAVRYDGATWQIFSAADLGLAAGAIRALALGEDGRLWAGAEGGAAVWDGAGWTPITAQPILALAVEGEGVWLGGETGLYRLTGDGPVRPVAGFPFGVSALAVDGRGWLWAGTPGEGLGRWDGQDWRFYRPGRGGLPHGIVTALAPAGPEAIWVGTAHPTEAGGALSRFDGQRWEHLTPRNSGFSAAEPLTIAPDGRGGWWIGTRTAGVDIFRQ